MAIQLRIEANDKYNIERRKERPEEQSNGKMFGMERS
jgi:hypothetical protein